MPNLLDFENKRMLFKKEIKKLKRASYSRDITLYIRRNQIFTDAGERGLTRDFFIELSKEMFN